MRGFFKKLTAFVLLLALVMTLFVGCGKQTNPQDTATQGAEAAPNSTAATNPNGNSDTQPSGDSTTPTEPQQ